MCVVSAMGDHYSDKFKPWIPPNIPQQDPFANQPKPVKLIDPFEGYNKLLPHVSRAEFDQLKREVEEMKKILKVAAEYDAKNNEPHCEIEDKVKLLKEIAKLVGVDINDVFPQLIMQPYMQVTTTEIIPSVLTTAGGTSGEITTYNVDYDKFQGAKDYGFKAKKYPQSLQNINSGSL